MLEQDIIWKLRIESYNMSTRTLTGIGSAIYGLNWIDFAMCSSPHISTG